MLDRMKRDNIIIINKNGEESEVIKAGIQSNKTFIITSKLVIEPGDIIKRLLSNGGEELYEVINPQFHERHRSKAPHYQIEHKRIGIEEKKKLLRVEITNPEEIAPELKEIASYLLNLTASQKEMLKLLANKNEILDEMKFLKNDEIALMKMEFEKLQEKDTSNSLPWGTFNSMISILISLANLNK